MNQHRTSIWDGVYSDRPSGAEVNRLQNNAMQALLELQRSGKELFEKLMKDMG